MNNFTSSIHSDKEEFESTEQKREFNRIIKDIKRTNKSCVKQKEKGRILENGF